MKNYDHSKIEKKWQKYWEKKKLNKAEDKSKKPKFYSLIEFPYPSGEGLHVGHIRSNTAMDIISRKRRAEGFNVLYPIGWDAFGLPTENYAIKTGIQPKIVTKKNTDTFRRQLQALGFSFDWSREVNTTDPAYYRWTQWIFLQMFKKGLAYKKKMAINWCPKDKIGLANEEVIDGKCERCGTPVEKREKEQWMLAITKYAERLDRDLDSVDFLEKIKIQQRNWIGKSEGAEIFFNLDFKKNPENNKRRDAEGNPARIPVFTTRPDTLFGATYLVLSPEHPWVKLAVDEKHDVLLNKKEVIEYVESAKKKTEMERTAEGKEKTGVELIGVKAINPANGEEIPMWVADYVLPDYGTGAIMAVPAHDERDYEFAKKFNLPIKNVIQPVITKIGSEDAFRNDAPIKERKAVVAVIKHWSEDKYLGVLWKKTNWGGFVIGGIEGGEDAKNAGLREITEETGFKNVKFVKSLGSTVHAKFFQMVKGENRFAHFEPALFQLENGEKQETTQEEKDLQNDSWLTPSEMADFITHDDMRIIWDRAIGRECYTGEVSNLHKFKSDGILENSGIFSTPEYKSYLMGAKQITDEDLHVLGAIIVKEEDSDRWLLLSEKALPAYEKLIAEKLTPGFWNEYVGKEIVFIFKHKDGKVERIVMGEKTVEKIDRLACELNNVVFDEKDADTYINGALIKNKWYSDALINNYSAKFPALQSNLAKVAIVNSVGGKIVTTFKLRDWVFSRQRYWGEPIPIIHCEKCGYVPVPEKDLPLKLPQVKNYQPTDTGESPLSAITKWVNVKCPECKGKAKRETDTMPNWAGSSWYFLRYIDPKNKKAFADSKKIQAWMPVDWYNGGMEHTTLHLLYSRFWYKFLYDLKFVSTSEPYQKRTSHGLILAEGGVKMSKSLGNVVNPDASVKNYGADSLRVYEMFMGPFDQPVAWSTDSIIGSRRFLERVWNLSGRIEIRDLKSEKISRIQEEFPVILHKTIKKVSEDIEAMRFNTAISSLMIALNEMEKMPVIGKSSYEVFLKLLAPFAPHIVEELWETLGNRKSITLEVWPKWKEEMLVEENVTIVVLVNGKVRAEFESPKDIDENTAKNKALSIFEVKKWIGESTPKRIIYVKNKLINIVI